MKGTERIVERAIAALKPYGPMPVVGVVLVFLGLTALSLRADPTATTLIVIVGFILVFVATERRAKREVEAEERKFDQLRADAAPAIHSRLRNRIAGQRREEELDIFGDRDEGGQS